MNPKDHLSEAEEHLRQAMISISAAVMQVMPRSVTAVPLRASEIIDCAHMLGQLHLNRVMLIRCVED